MNCTESPSDFSISRMVPSYVAQKGHSRSRNATILVRPVLGDVGEANCNARSHTEILGDLSEIHIENSARTRETAAQRAQPFSFGSRRRIANDHYSLA